MNRSSRLALIKSILAAMMIYTSIAVGLTPWVHEALDKITKAFLWE